MSGLRDASEGALADNSVLRVGRAGRLWGSRFTASRTGESPSCDVNPG